jgi:adenine-specific DNA-methyltransferase
VKHYTERLRDRSRQLRRDQTDAEKALWRLLRAHSLAGFKFRRQHPVAGYIADFVCLEKRVIIELDGGQHADQTAFDQAREAKLRALGFHTIRIWDNQLLEEREAAAMVILEALTAPHPNPLPASGERGEERGES